MYITMCYLFDRILHQYNSNRLVNHYSQNTFVIQMNVKSTTPNTSKASPKQYNNSRTKSMQPILQVTVNQLNPVQLQIKAAFDRERDAITSDKVAQLKKYNEDQRKLDRNMDITTNRMQTRSHQKVLLGQAAVRGAAITKLQHLANKYTAKDPSMRNIFNKYIDIWTKEKSSIYIDYDNQLPIYTEAFLVPDQTYAATAKGRSNSNSSDESSTTNVSITNTKNGNVSININTNNTKEPVGNDTKMDMNSPIMREINELLADISQDISKGSDHGEGAEAVAEHQQELYHLTEKFKQVFPKKKSSINRKLVEELKQRSDRLKQFKAEIHQLSSSNSKVVQSSNSSDRRNDVKGMKGRISQEKVETTDIASLPFSSGLPFSSAVRDNSSINNQYVTGNAARLPFSSTNVTKDAVQKGFSGVFSQYVTDDAAQDPQPPIIKMDKSEGTLGNFISSSAERNYKRRQQESAEKEKKLARIQRLKKERDAIDMQLKKESMLERYESDEESVPMLYEDDSDSELDGIRTKLNESVSTKELNEWLKNLDKKKGTKKWNSSDTEEEELITSTKKKKTNNRPIANWSPSPSNSEDSESDTSHTAVSIGSNTDILGAYRKYKTDKYDPNTLSPQVRQYGIDQAKLEVVGILKAQLQKATPARGTYTMQYVKEFVDKHLHIHPDAPAGYYVTGLPIITDGLRQELKQFQAEQSHGGISHPRCLIACQMLYGATKTKVIPDDFGGQQLVAVGNIMEGTELFYFGTIVAKSRISNKEYMRDHESILETNGIHIDGSGEFEMSAGGGIRKKYTNQLTQKMNEPRITYTHQETANCIITKHGTYRVLVVVPGCPSHPMPLTVWYEERGQKSYGRAYREEQKVHKLHEIVNTCQYMLVSDRNVSDYGSLHYMRLHKDETISTGYTIREVYEEMSCILKEYQDIHRYDCKLATERIRVKGRKIEQEYYSTKLYQKTKRDCAYTEIYIYLCALDGTIKRLLPSWSNTITRALTKPYYPIPIGIHNIADTMYISALAQVIAVTFGNDLREEDKYYEQEEFLKDGTKVLYKTVSKYDKYFQHAIASGEVELNREVAQSKIGYSNRSMSTHSMPVAQTPIIQEKDIPPPTPATNRTTRASLARQESKEKIKQLFKIVYTIIHLITVAPTTPQQYLVKCGDYTNGKYTEEQVYKEIKDILEKERSLIQSQCKDDAQYGNECREFLDEVRTYTSFERLMDSTEGCTTGLREVAMFELALIVKHLDGEFLKVIRDYNKPLFECFHDSSIPYFFDEHHFKVKMRFPLHLMILFISFRADLSPRHHEYDLEEILPNGTIGLNNTTKIYLSCYKQAIKDRYIHTSREAAVVYTGMKQYTDIPPSPNRENIMYTPVHQPNHDPIIQTIKLPQRVKVVKVEKVHSITSDSSSVSNEDTKEVPIVQQKQTQDQLHNLVQELTNSIKMLVEQQREHANDATRNVLLQQQQQLADLNKALYEVNQIKNNDIGLSPPRKKYTVEPNSPKYGLSTLSKEDISMETNVEKLLLALPDTVDWYDYPHIVDVVKRLRELAPTPATGPYSKGKASMNASARQEINRITISIMLLCPEVCNYSVDSAISALVNKFRENSDYVPPIYKTDKYEGNYGFKDRLGDDVDVFQFLNRVLSYFYKNKTMLTVLAQDLGSGIYITGEERNKIFNAHANRNTGNMDRVATAIQEAVNLNRYDLRNGYFALMNVMYAYIQMFAKQEQYITPNQIQSYIEKIQLSSVPYHLPSYQELRDMVQNLKRHYELKSFDENSASQILTDIENIIYRSIEGDSFATQYNMQLQEKFQDKMQSCITEANVLFENNDYRGLVELYFTTLMQICEDGIRIYGFVGFKRPGADTNKYIAPEKKVIIRESRTTPPPRGSRVNSDPSRRHNMLLRSQYTQVPLNQLETEVDFTEFETDEAGEDEITYSLQELTVQEIIEDNGELFTFNNDMRTILCNVCGIASCCSNTINAKGERQSICKYMNPDNPNVISVAGLAGVNPSWNSQAMKMCIEKGFMSRISAENIKHIQEFVGKLSEQKIKDKEARESTYNNTRINSTPPRYNSGRGYSPRGGRNNYDSRNNNYDSRNRSTNYPQREIPTATLPISDTKPIELRAESPGRPNPVTVITHPALK